MNIVFHGANAANFRDGFDARLEGAHDIVNLSDTLAAPGEGAAFENADVIVGIKLGPDEPLPLKARLYHAPAAGTDQIDRARLPAGAQLCNCYGHEDAIAEYVIAALLLRHVPIPHADERLRQGHWDYWAGLPGSPRTELGALKLGLLGFGHIGKAIARRAKAFGMRIAAANRTPVPVGGDVDESFTLDRLAEFFAAADIAVVSLPLTEATRGIVGARELGAMRETAIIVNVGRGPVIEEQALFDALSHKRIGGAIIDTWYNYPSPAAPRARPSLLPFETLPNVTMTPHMSGWTGGTIVRRQETIAGNVKRLMRGEKLVNLVE